MVLGVIGTFLAGISINHLHWDRWVIEALPFMALLTAFGLEISVMKVLARVNFWKYGYNLPICILAVILAALPADALIKNDIMQTRYSTAIIARQWVLDHIPLGRTIAQEFHAAPMIEKYYKVFNSQFCLSDKPLDFYKENGFEYLVANEAVYGRFFKEPKRYQKEIQFYQELPVKAEEVQVILPTEQHGGPTIKIYRLVKGAGD